MSDLIERDWILKRMVFAPDADTVRMAPAVEVEPVRSGSWVYDPNGMDFNLGAWVCSKCKERNNNLGGMRRINPYMFAGSRFCPNCGAKMDQGV